MDKRLKELEKKIGYTFENHKLLERAMMHSSYTNESIWKNTDAMSVLNFWEMQYWN